MKEVINSKNGFELLEFLMRIRKKLENMVKITAKEKLG